MANTTIYPYGTNGQLPSSIGVINDLTTGGADKALSADMGKELGNTVNGIAGVTGSWTNGRYGSFVAVGSTYTETKATSYPFNNGNYKCCKIPLIAGQKLTFTAKSNGEKTLAVVDGDSKVTYVDGSNGVKYANATKDATTDLGITTTGYAYISNFYDGTASWVQCSAATSGIDGHEQRITDLESAVSDVEDALESIPDFSQLEEDIAAVSTLDNRLTLAINGRETAATFVTGIYGGTSGKTVGSTYVGTLNNGYGMDVYKCCKLEVHEGDLLLVDAQIDNTYHQAVVITKTDGEVTYCSGTAKAHVQNEFEIEYDGYAYINTQVSLGGSAKLTHIGNEQEINAVKHSLSAITNVVERQKFSLPLTIYGVPYPNSTYYYWETNVSASSTDGCTGWVALPKGTYLKNTERSGTLYQSDTPLFGKDYAKKDENVFSKILSASTETVQITKNYAFFIISGSSSSPILELTPIEITAAVAEQPSNRLAHVAHGTDDFILYIPMKDKFMVAQIKAYTQVVQSGFNQYPHYGIELFYDSGAGDAFIPRLGTPLTRSGETECAININGTGIENYAGGHSGYIGGHAHGFERIVAADTTVYVDGTYKQASDRFNADINTMFELSTHTQYLAPSGIGTENEVVIADLYKRWRVIDGKLHLYNRVVWNIPVHIARAQFSMFCIYRHEGGTSSNPYLTNRATRNDNTFVYTTTDGWDTSALTERSSILTAPAKATKQEQWGESGFIVTQEILENNATDNGGLFINTNSGGTYNKMYFEIGSNFDVVEGDELFSHAVLSIE